jgi:DNA-directed RNA polymerase specialized sigma24 family protein
MNGFLTSLEEALPGLRRYALAMLSDQRDADNIVRTCLARALGRLSESGEAARLRIWLFAIMYRELATRSPPRRRRRLSSPHGNNVNPEASTELARAFSGLRLEQRSAMFLISVENLSYAAAAEVMAMPTAAIVELLKVGREELRQAVEAGASGLPLTGS